MTMHYHITPISSNAKTGPVAVTTTSANSCPPSCPMNSGGCYAKAGPLALHWRKVNEGARGTSSTEEHAADIAHALRKLPSGARLVRLNQAGDLPGNGENIDADALSTLANACGSHGGRGWTYTHKKTPEALATIDAMQAAKPALVVNISADTLHEADKHASQGRSVCVTVPAGSPDKLRTPQGRAVIACPAESRDDVTCAACQLCAKHSSERRGLVIAFRAHGTARRKLSEKLVKLSELAASIA